MKRISTLFLTACLALASFAQVATLPRPVKATEFQAGILKKNIHATPLQRAPQGEQVVEVAATITDLSYWQGAWNIIAADEAGIYNFSVEYKSANADSPIGKFYYDDCVFEGYTYFTVSGSNVAIKEITLDITGSATEGYTAIIELLGADNKTYKITATKAASVPVEAINVVAPISIWELDEEERTVFIYAESSDGWFLMWSIQLGTDMAYINKTFTEADIVGDLASEEAYVGVISDAEIICTEADGTITLSGYIVDGETGQRYNILLTKAGEEENVINLVATNADFDVDEGILFITASNDTYTSINLAIDLAGNTDYIGRTFTAASITQFYVMPWEYFELTGASITIAQEDNVISAEGTASLADGRVVNIDLSYTQVPVTATHDLPFAAPVKGSVEGGSMILFKAEGQAPASGTPEGYNYVTCNLALNITELGELTLSNTDVNHLYTSLRYLDITGEKDPITLNIASVNKIKLAIDYTAIAYTRLNITAEFVTTDGIQYNVSMWYADGTLADDAYPGVWHIDAVNINRTFTDDDENVIAIFTQSSYGNYAMFRAIGRDDVIGLDDQVAIAFNVETEDPDIIIPAGEYPIDDSFEYGTVDQGSADETSLYASYYAFRSANGVYVPAFFFYEGKVVVEKLEGNLLKLTVTATNSYGLPINITYTEVAAETALDNTSADAPQARKVIAPNGQLQIIRGEHIYDATGAILK